MLLTWLLHVTNLFRIFLVSSITDIQKSWVRLQDIMKLNIIIINFYCLFAFWFLNTFLLPFQVLLCNHVRDCKSIFKWKHLNGQWLPDHSSHHLPHRCQHSLQSSLLLVFFLHAMESLHDSSFILRTQSFPTFPYALKNLCLGNPESKEGKDDLGQPLHEIITEAATLFISSNKLEELIQDRTVWVWLTCALCIGQYNKWTD